MYCFTFKSKVKVLYCLLRRNLFSTLLDKTSKVRWYLKSFRSPLSSLKRSSQDRYQIPILFVSCWFCVATEVVFLALTKNVTSSLLTSFVKSKNVPDFLTQFFLQLFKTFLFVWNLSSQRFGVVVLLLLCCSDVVVMLWWCCYVCCCCGGGVVWQLLFCCCCGGGNCCSFVGVKVAVVV